MRHANQTIRSGDRMSARDRGMTPKRLRMRPGELTADEHLRQHRAGRLQTGWNESVGGLSPAEIVLMGRASIARLNAEQADELRQYIDSHGRERTA